MTVDSEDAKRSVQASKEGKVARRDKIPGVSVFTRLGRMSFRTAVVAATVFSVGLVWVFPHLLTDVPSSPRPLSAYAENTIYTAFGSRSPRTLDPQRSYSADEAVYVHAIYEPLYQYAYLKRPYELEARAAESVAHPLYRDASGAELPDDAPAEQIAESVYEIHIRSGMRFAPHPCFARDAAGKPLYWNLSAEVAKTVRSPFDLPETGTREVTSYDYARGIRRIASPQVVSPVFGTLAERIVGLREYRAGLEAQWREQRKNVGADAWLDLERIPLAGVETPDARTLRIRIRGKDPQFSYWLAMNFFAPVPEEAERFYAQPGLRANNVSLDTWPVGTGAFRMREFLENRRHVLERNPLYMHGHYPCEGSPADKEAGLLEDCGRPLPLVDRIVFDVEKESVPLQSKFLAGYYDSPFIERTDTGLGFLVAREDDPTKAGLYAERQLQFPRTVQAGFWYLGFNWLDPVVGGGNSPEAARRARLLRRAISIAVDWEENLAIFQKNQGVVAHGPLPPGLFGWRDDGPSAFNPVVYMHDATGRTVRRPIEEARALLAQAGWPDGRDARTGEPLILYFDYQNAAQGASAYLEWYQRQLKKLGIQLEIRATDYNRFQEKMARGAAQLFLWGWNADYPDAENFLFLFYGPNGKVQHEGENAMNYENPAFDRRFERMRLLENGPEKAKLIDEMISILQEDAPVLFGYFPPGAAAYQGWLGNARPSGMVQNILQYMKVDSTRRAAAIQAWNKPVVWPLGLLAFTLLLLVWGGVRLAVQRSSERLRVPDAKVSNKTKGEIHS